MKLWLTALSLLLVVAPPAAASLFDDVPFTKAGDSDNQMIDVLRRTEWGLSCRHDVRRCGRRAPALKGEHA